MEYGKLLKISKLTLFFPPKACSCCLLQYLAGGFLFMCDEGFKIIFQNERILTSNGNIILSWLEDLYLPRKVCLCICTFSFLFSLAVFAICFQFFVSSC